MQRKPKKPAGSLQKKSILCLASLEKAESLLDELGAAALRNATLPVATIDKIIGRVSRIGSASLALTRPMEVKPPMPGAPPEEVPDVAS